jgi:hypothetical protein
MRMQAACAAANSASATPSASSSGASWCMNAALREALLRAESHAAAAHAQDEAGPH